MMKILNFMIQYLSVSISFFDIYYSVLQRCRDLKAKTEKSVSSTCMHKKRLYIYLINMLFQKNVLPARLLHNCDWFSTSIQTLTLEPRVVLPFLGTNSFEEVSVLLNVWCFSMLNLARVKRGVLCSGHNLICWYTRCYCAKIKYSIVNSNLKPTGVTQLQLHFLLRKVYSCAVCTYRFSPWDSRITGHVQ